MFWDWEGIRRMRYVQTNSLENEDVLWLKYRREKEDGEEVWISH